MKTPHCKLCDQEGHYSFQCFKRKQKPIKKMKQLKSAGKHHRLWQVTKRKWYTSNPSDYYSCYICGRTLTKGQTTLDHVIPRSARPDLRYDLNNLKPCCLECNIEKGSKH